MDKSQEEKDQAYIRYTDSVILFVMVMVTSYGSNHKDKGEEEMTIDPTDKAPEDLIREKEETEANYLGERVCGCKRYPGELFFAPDLRADNVICGRCGGVVRLEKEPNPLSELEEEVKELKRRMDVIEASLPGMIE